MAAPIAARWSRETFSLLKGSTIEQRDTAFCSLRKLPFCTAIWLMSMRRLKICPTGCLDEAWDLAISPKSLTAAFPSPPSDSATKGTNSWLLFLARSAYLLFLRICAAFRTS